MILCGFVGQHVNARKLQGKKYSTREVHGTRSLDSNCVLPVGDLKHITKLKPWVCWVFWWINTSGLGRRPRSSLISWFQCWSSCQRNEPLLPTVCDTLGLPSSGPLLSLHTLQAISPWTQETATDHFPVSRRISA